MSEPTTLTPHEILTHMEEMADFLRRCLATERAAARDGDMNLNPNMRDFHLLCGVLGDHSRTYLSKRSDAPSLSSS